MEHSTLYSNAVWTVFNCTLLHCIQLYFTAHHCTAMYCIVYITVLQYTVHYIALYRRGGRQIAFCARSHWHTDRHTQLCTLNYTTHSTTLHTEIHCTLKYTAHSTTMHTILCAINYTTHYTLHTQLNNTLCHVYCTLHTTTRTELTTLHYANSLLYTKLLTIVHILLQ